MLVSNVDECIVEDPVEKSVGETKEVVNVDPVDDVDDALVEAELQPFWQPSPVSQ